MHQLKQVIKQEQSRRGVAMFIDLHGHSRKQNIFLYGADEKRKGLSRPAARVFPKVLVQFSTVILAVPALHWRYC